jgi:hypothetical protein
MDFMQFEYVEIGRHRPINSRLRNSSLERGPVWSAEFGLGGWGNSRHVGREVGAPDQAQAAFH